MNIATLAQIKRELKLMPPERQSEIILRLAKYKKETKELLHYLIYEVEDESSYIEAVKEDIDEAFEQVNGTNLYWAKKTIRKTLRITTKHIRFSGQKQTEVELLIYFCQVLRDSGLPIDESTVLENLYDRQIIKIEKALSYLHEDLQFDYQTEVDELK
ncbi:MAG: hypothetical protein ACJA0X_002243 [Cyclobacteriaceae bacterium]|jgi:hypothetical protein